MGLSIDTIRDQEEAKMGKFEVTERLYKTADGKVVKEGDPDAAFLYASPGKQIPAAEAEEAGLVKPKQAAKPADKQRAPAKDKSRKSPKRKQE